MRDDVMADILSDWSTNGDSPGNVNLVLGLKKNKECL